MAGLLACGRGALAASPADGQWRAQTHQGLIQIYDCGADLCGRVVSSDLIRDHPELKDSRNPDPALRSRMVKGLTILSGFSGGPTRWRGGSVYDPQTGATYRGAIQVVDDHTVKITGCIVFPLCGFQIWTRVE